MGFRSDLHGAVPGFTAAAETYESVVSWGKADQALIVGAIIDGTARDSGNTPTTVLRVGLLLGQIASTGELKEYSPTATDGTAKVHGVLLSSFRMQDLDGNNQDRFVWILFGGPVQAGKCINLDEQARATMAGRFVFDDRAQPNSLGWNNVVAKTADYTVVNGDDNNVIFTNLGAAGAVNFTLPATIKKGQKWRFIAEADQNLTVTAPANKLVTFNDATATSVSFQTASEIIGGAVEIVANSDATKYMAFLMTGETQTVTYV